MNIPLSPLNTAIIFIYLASMLAVGIILAVRQKSTEDYFLAGRNMGWLAVGMSMFASVTSAVTYIGVPGMVFKENIALIVFCFLSPLIAPILILFIYPFYRSINATTSYEYIAKRFGKGARPVVSSLFILARLGWLGTVIYAPALALSVMTGMDVWIAICLMGLLATAYTVLGGIAADIWTDVVQYIILVAGAIWVAVALVNVSPDGIHGIMSTAMNNGKLEVFTWKISLFNGPVLALFLLGFFTVRGKFIPWVIGTAITIPATFWFQNSVKAHWVYYLPFAALLCLCISYSLSFLFKDSRDLSGLTVWTKKTRLSR
jgi:Na+/proline symporter